MRYDAKSIPIWKYKRHYRYGYAWFSYVCKTGPEVHEHIDEGLFKRLGLPNWLITQTAEEYVTAICLAETTKNA